MQNTPFNGAGRRPAPHPLPAIIPSPTAIHLCFAQSALCRICMYRVIQEYVIIHEMWKERKSTCSKCVGGPGRLPAPSPPLRWRSCGGGGRLANHVLPGDFERGRGFSGKWIRRVILAGGSGRFSWQDIVAGHFGGFIWRVILAHLFVGFPRVKKKQAVEQRKRSKRNV